MKGNLSRMTPIVLLVTCIIVQGVSIWASSPGTPTVSVDPPTNTAGVGETFKINVTVSGITDDESLYGWSLQMNFNPRVLNVTEVLYGTWLGEAANWPVIGMKKRIYNEEGYVIGGQMLAPQVPPPTYPEKGATGGGTLATITFQVKRIGGSLLELARMELITVVGGTPVEIDHEAFEGVFDNRGGANEPPVAIFNATPLVESPTKTVAFNASASYDPDAWLVSYHWDFGDGTTEIYMREDFRDINFETYHFYNQSGTYTVTLTVTDNDDATNTATAGIIVTYDVAITNLTISPTRVMSGDQVTINATVKNEGNFTTPPDLEVATYYDGNLIGNKSVYFTPPIGKLDPGASKTLNFTWNTTGVALGKYTIKAVASEVEGETDTTDNTKTKQIKIVEHDIAVSHISVPTQVKVEETVMINVTIENIGIFKEASNLTVSYDTTLIGFNDTVELPSGASTNVSFSWNTTGVAAGVYTINATATVLPTLENPLAVDDDPTDNTKTTTIRIVAHDVAVTDVDAPIWKKIGATVMINVTVENQGVYTENLNLTVSYDDTYIGSENVTLATGASQTVSFNWNTTGVAAGVYTINATATVLPTLENPLAVDDDPTDNTKLGDKVTIKSTPVASFTYLPLAPYAGETVTFNASASYDIDGWIVNYMWNFGDGNITTVSNITTIITHSYAAAGTYTVTLNATDNDGLNNTYTQSITIGRTSSTIYVALSPESITLGENTTISGSIDPERSGVAVTIWYRLKGEETWSTVTTSTDENSQYSHVWTPDSTGTYEIKASWEGDENTFADETEVRELTVQEAPPPPSSGPATPLSLIAAIVAAVIIITIIAGYFIRAKKPT